MDKQDKQKQYQKGLGDVTAFFVALLRYPQPEAQESRADHQARMSDDERLNERLSSQILLILAGIKVEEGLRESMQEVVIRNPDAMVAAQEKGELPKAFMRAVGREKGCRYYMDAVHRAQNLMAGQINETPGLAEKMTFISKAFITMAQEGTVIKPAEQAGQEPKLQSVEKILAICTPS